MNASGIDGIIEGNLNKVRIEKDSMGELAVLIDAIYGASTQYAINNLKSSEQPILDVAEAISDTSSPELERLLDPAVLTDNTKTVQLFYLNEETMV